MDNSAKGLLYHFMDDWEICRFFCISYTDKKSFETDFRCASKLLRKHFAWRREQKYSSFFWFPTLLSKREQSLFEIKLVHAWEITEFLLCQQTVFKFDSDKYAPAIFTTFFGKTCCQLPQKRQTKQISWKKPEWSVSWPVWNIHWDHSWWHAFVTENFKY